MSGQPAESLIQITESTTVAADVTTTTKTNDAVSNESVSAKGMSLLNCIHYTNIVRQKDYAHFTANNLYLDNCLTFIWLF